MSLMTKLHLQKQENVITQESLNCTRENLAVEMSEIPLIHFQKFILTETPGRILEELVKMETQQLLISPLI